MGRSELAIYLGPLFILGGRAAPPNYRVARTGLFLLGGILTVQGAWRLYTKER